MVLREGLAPNCEPLFKRVFSGLKIPELSLHSTQGVQDPRDVEGARGGKFALDAQSFFELFPGLRKISEGRAGAAEIGQARSDVGVVCWEGHAADRQRLLVALAGGCKLAQQM